MVGHRLQLAIISDTHLPRGGRALPERCIELCRGAAAIIHAGDLIGVEVLEQLRSLGPPLHAVHGNVDAEPVRAALPARLELAFGAVTLGVVHNPGPARDRAAHLARRFPGCAAVIFGHTHLPEHDRHGPVQIFNPGSPTDRRRAPTHTMGLARISGEALEFELVDLG
jgi:uncharacterized protein